MSDSNEGFLTLDVAKSLAGSIEGARERRQRPHIAALIRSRDPEVLRAVVQTYLEPVHRAARGAGLGPVEAEEITQSTFTTFLETAPRFEGRSSVKTWLFGILYRKIFEGRRRRRNDERQVELDDAFDACFAADGRWTSVSRPADAELSGKEVRQQISQCLDAAPDRQKMAFLLREVEGFSSEEICEILGMTKTNLGVTLHRIRHRLRECLSVQGVRPAA